MKKIIITNILLLNCISYAFSGNYDCTQRDKDGNLIERKTINIKKGQLGVFRKLTPIEGLVIGEDLSDAGEKNKLLINIAIFDSSDESHSSEVNASAEVGSRLKVFDVKSRIVIECRPYKN